MSWRLPLQVEDVDGHPEPAEVHDIAYRGSVLAGVDEPEVESPPAPREDICVDGLSAISLEGFLGRVLYAMTLLAGEVEVPADVPALVFGLSLHLIITITGGVDI